MELPNDTIKIIKSVLKKHGLYLEGDDLEDYVIEAITRANQRTKAMDSIGAALEVVICRLMMGVHGRDVDEYAYYVSMITLEQGYLYNLFQNIKSTEGLVYSMFGGLTFEESTNRAFLNEREHLMRLANVEEHIFTKMLMENVAAKISEEVTGQGVDDETLEEWELIYRAWEDHIATAKAPDQLELDADEIVEWYDKIDEKNKIIREAYRDPDGRMQAVSIAMADAILSVNSGLLDYEFAERFFSIVRTLDDEQAFEDVLGALNKESKDFLDGLDI